MNDKHPTWFKLKIERRDLVQQLQPEEAVRVILACWHYLETSQRPEGLSPIEAVAFSAFLPDIEEALANYEKRVNARGKSHDVTRPHVVSCEAEVEVEEEKETEEDIPPISPKGGNMSAFESFWSAYPKRVGKGNAERAWEKLSPNAELTERILFAIERGKQSDQWKESGGRYIPYPATWLNQKRWEDELEACTIRASSYDINELEALSHFDPPEEL